MSLWRRFISRVYCWAFACFFVTGCGSAEDTVSLGYLTQLQHEAAVTGTKLSILAWNVESGGNDPNVIAAQLRELTGYDIYCLCEVHADSFDRYTAAVGEGFVSLNSKTGRGDRMQISFNGNRFELLQGNELHRHGNHELNNGNHRSPLFVRLKDRRSGVQFIVMTNHLARASTELRTQQAIGLREWARNQNVAMINIGDFNMDFDFKSQRGNEAFTEMLRDDIWNWVRPSPLIDTNWSDSDGVDRYPDSMLDFAFVAGSAKTWSPVCNVIVRGGDFPDDDSTSDHRPVELRLTIPNGR